MLVLGIHILQLLSRILLYLVLLLLVAGTRAVAVLVSVIRLLFLLFFGFSLDEFTCALLDLYNDAAGIWGQSGALNDRVLVDAYAMLCFFVVFHCCGGATSLGVRATIALSVFRLLLLIGRALGLSLVLRLRWSNWALGDFFLIEDGACLRWILGLILKRARVLLCFFYLQLILEDGNFIFFFRLILPFGDDFDGVIFSPFLLFGGVSPLAAAAGLPNPGCRA